MNTGIADAHNIGWKLAAVLKGQAAVSLLDSYEIERKPIAAQNTIESVRNYHNILEVPEAFGLDRPLAVRARTLVQPGPDVASAVADVLPGDELQALGLGRKDRRGRLLSRWQDLQTGRDGRKQLLQRRGQFVP